MSEPQLRSHVSDKRLAPPCLSLRPVVAPECLYTSLSCQRPFAKVRAWRQSILTSPLSGIIRSLIWNTITYSFNGVVNIIIVCKNWQVLEGKPDGEGMEGL